MEEKEFLEKLIYQIRVFQSKNFGQRPTCITISYIDFGLLTKYLGNCFNFEVNADTISYEGILIIKSPDLEKNQITIGEIIKL